MTPAASAPVPTVIQVLAAAITTAVATVALAGLAYFQIRTGTNVARDSLEAAKRQWQPRVSARAWTGPIPGEVGEQPPHVYLAAYYLENQGTGPAFNIEHGIELDRKLQPSGYPEDLTLGAGQEYPPVHNLGVPGGVRPLVISTKHDEVFSAKDFVLWARFENLVGERFEVRTFVNQSRPADFKRL